MKAEQDLNSQQEHLAAIDYDLRITNLARFIYKKIRDSRLRGNDNTNVIPESEASQESLKLIDVGAGNGLFLKFFKNHGFEVTGIELEEELVAKMKKDPQLKGVSISQGDITKLTGKADYDVTIASDVIEHIKDYEKAIKNLWSFVAPGGLLIITVPAHSFLYGKRDEAWGHFRRYDKKKLELKVKSLKFAEIHTLTFWNLVGYFVYFFYEKVLHKQINEEMRYGKSFKSKIVRTVLDFILKVEEMIGGLPLGLTLVAIVQKAKR